MSTDDAPPGAGNDAPIATALRLRGTSRWRSWPARLTLLGVLLAISGAVLLLSGPRRLAPLLRAAGQPDQAVPVQEMPAASSTAPAEPAAVAAPASTPTLPATSPLAQEVIRAYQRYWVVYAEALYSLDTSPLGEVTAGEALQESIAEVEELRAEGLAGKVHAASGDHPTHLSRQPPGAADPGRPARPRRTASPLSVTRSLPAAHGRAAMRLVSAEARFEGDAMKIRNVTCTVGRRSPQDRGYPLVWVWGEDGLYSIGEASPMHPDVTKVAVETRLKPLLVAMSVSGPWVLRRATRWPGGWPQTARP